MFHFFSGSMKDTPAPPEVRFILCSAFIKSQYLTALFNGIDDVIKLQADINNQKHRGGLGPFTALFTVLHSS